MSRHRIVRSMDYNDEYDGYDDVYGTSVDDDNCISPSDASQWIYDRAKGQQSISAFMAKNENIEEEDESESLENGDGAYEKKRRDSENFQMPVLDDITQAKLMSCMDEIRNVVGESVSDRQMFEAVTKHDYDVTKALDSILNATSERTQQRQIPRPAKDSSDKDVKANLAISNVKFKIPTLKPSLNMSSPLGGEGSSKKIDEYIKRNFQNIGFGNNASKPIFIVPQLKPGNSPAESPRQEQQLTISSSQSASPMQSGSNFIIPKLGSSLTSSSSESQVQSPSNHDLLLKKIMDSKKSKTIEVQELSSSFEKKLALENKIPNSSDETDVMASNQDSENISDQSQEIINDEIPLTDCDKLQEDRKSEQGLSCRLDLSEVLNENISKFVAKPTNFGKIMILKYRCRYIPYVSHSFKTKNQISRFKFESRSPDDIILSHLNKHRI